MNVFKLITCQGVAVGLVLLGLLPLAGKLDVNFPAVAWPPVIGAVAAVIGWRFGLQRWWALVQFVFPLAVVGATWLALPALIWAALFVLTLLVYWNSFRGGVPLYLSNQTTWAALAEMLPKKPGSRFVDLGGGIGGTVLYLAACRPDCEFVSVESAPVPHAISWLRKVISGRSNIHVVFGDIRKYPLHSFDVVYAFLSPRPMLDLFLKARDEMAPGALFVSNSFDVPGHPADDVMQLEDRRRTRLHVWRFQSHLSKIDGP